MVLLLTSLAPYRWATPAYRVKKQPNEALQPLAMTTCDGTGGWGTTSTCRTVLAIPLVALDRMFTPGPFKSRSFDPISLGLIKWVSCMRTDSSSESEDDSFLLASRRTLYGLCAVKANEDIRIEESAIFV